MVLPEVRCLEQVGTTHTVADLSSGPVPDVGATKRTWQHQAYGFFALNLFVHAT